MWQFPIVTWGGKQRDNQRARVYSAERTISWGHSLPEMEVLSAWVEAICRSTWMKKNFGNVQLRVTDGRGRRNACGGGMRIRMPKWSRHELIILHEIAHNLVPRGFAWHGPDFCRVYLALVEEFMGEGKADELKAAFRQKNVNFLAWRGK